MVCKSAMYKVNYMTGTSEGHFNLLGKIKMNDTDNQQKRLMDIGWLAGIIEGEGCFSLQGWKAGKRTQRSASPLIQISNTNPLIIQKAQRIIKDEGLPCYVYAQLGKRVTACYRVVIMGLKRAQKFLNFIIPYLDCRKDQAEFLQKWTDSRLSRPPRSPWNDFETFCADQLCRLNRPYLFSETKCLPLEHIIHRVQDEDIVRSE